MAASRQALLLVPTLGLVYVASQFYRATNAVIAPDLMRELHLSSDAMGMLTGAFFFAFALAQIPVGVLLDRYGPRRTNMGLLLVAAAGALVFAGSTSVEGLIAGRILLGIGSSGVLMGSIMIFARWFPPDRLASAISVMVAVGAGGIILATWPLALAVQAIGWRSTFVGAAIVTACLVPLLVFLVRDGPPGWQPAGGRTEPLGAILRGLPRVWRIPPIKYFFAVHLTTLSAVLTVLGLWGGPYLADVHGLDAVGRGRILLAMSIASIAGNLSYGPLDRIFDTRKRLVLCGGSVTICVLSTLALLQAPPLWAATLLFMALAFGGSITIILQTHSRGLLPDNMAGRGLTVLNMSTMLGVALGQTMSGVIVGAFPAVDGAYPEAAYRCVFAYLACVLVLGLLAYTRVADVRPSDQRLKTAAR
ncbi:putative MFS family arabinose efflux permease [Stella humosa]|uniref:Putative MFS family arabinose efflux permease n=1 Tax=Stella humosa TaxID=94 RepID=A0A3N1MFY1_9PROT|nr:MFS transporter [Stella humosa]ROQ01647.1 putative MFS family arabinose efflux permease [Stella humosa]BBK32028.1 MFS transporter [Stella humosa]